MARQESYQHDMLYHTKGRYTMTELNVSQIIANCEANAIPDDEIDTSVIPPITDFKGFDFGNTKYFETKPKKTQVSIRLNTILLDHLKSMGEGWQTRLNDYLMQSFFSGKI